MDYFFFDIECCDGAHICSFGYVLTDENFNVLEKRDILINPRKPFMPRRVTKMLAYPVSAFRAAPDFAAAYETIFGLMTKKGQILVGFAVSNDINFLVHACGRYKLKMPELEFFDAQILYAHLRGENNMPALNKAAAALEVAAGALHKSDDDADTVKEILKKLCADAGLCKNSDNLDNIDCDKGDSVARKGQLSASGAYSDVSDRAESCHLRDNQASLAQSLFEKYNQCRGYVKNGETYVYTTNYPKLFRTYIKRFKPEKIEGGGEFKGKRFCFSPGLEKNTPLKLWTLAEILITRGAVITESAAQANIFIWDGKESCPSYKYIKRQKNARVKIVPITELEGFAGVKLEDLQDHATDNYCPIYSMQKG